MRVSLHTHSSARRDRLPVSSLTIAARPGASLSEPSSSISPWVSDTTASADGRLDRDVALKLLPPSLATDPDRLMRFEREAKTLAALNHPHSAQIDGFERTDAVSALVMELVDGVTLAELIDGASRPGRAGISLADALPIARQCGSVA